MARKCDCGFILEAFETDPRLACLPLAVRALWLVLVRRMQQLGQSVLVFGSEIPNPAEIAMMVPIAETELETQLAPLLARGLLVRRADGALESPLLAARQKRAETARINGLKGGRPRKDGAPPGQRTMPLPIAGGRAVADGETHGKPSVGSSASPAKLSSSSAEKAEAEASGAREVVTPELVRRVGHAAAEAARLDPARGTFAFGVVRQWLEAGADEALILATIGAVMARGTAAPRGLLYFDGAVKDALRTRPAAAAAPEACTWAEEAEAFIARHEAWEASGRMGEAPVRRRAA